MTEPGPGSDDDDGPIGLQVSCRLTDSHVRSRSRSSPAASMAATHSGCATSSTSTSANRSTSSGSTTRTASPPTSGRAPRFDTTSTAVPQAMASTATMPYGSAIVVGTHTNDAAR